MLSLLSEYCIRKSQSFSSKRCLFGRLTAGTNLGTVVGIGERKNHGIATLLEKCTEISTNIY